MKKVTYTTRRPKPMRESLGIGLIWWLRRVYRTKKIRDELRPNDRGPRAGNFTQWQHWAYAPSTK